MPSSLLRFKAGVVVPKVTIIAAALVNAANQLGLTKDMVVTSGNDSQHKIGSLHYSDCALDFRTKHLTSVEKRQLLTALKRRLGPAYQVLLEDEGLRNEHGHAEYDP
jgi:hypothetical protein